MLPMPTVNNQQPYMACSIETNNVDLVLLNVSAKISPPINVRMITKVFLKKICPNENTMAFIKKKTLWSEKKFL